MFGRASGDGGEQARVRAGQDRGDHADHSGCRPEGWPVPAAQAQDGKPPRWRDAGQVVSQFWGEVEVVGPEPHDPFDVMKLFDPGLEHAVEGDEAKEGQRRQQYQAEGIECGADAGGCGDQPEGDEPGGYRADVRVSRSDPGSKSTRLCRWPVAWLVMKSGSGNDLDGENHGDEPVDGGAERRPPPCADDVVAALLPEVLEAVACVAQDQKPGRSGDARRGQHDERASDGALDGDHLGSSVCHREPDVDPCDQG